MQDISVKQLKKLADDNQEIKESTGIICQSI
jgi:hypothetical protein